MPFPTKFSNLVQIILRDGLHFFRWINIKLHTRFPTKVVILGAYLVLSPNRLTLIDTLTSVQRNAKQFYRRNRFIELYVVHWLIVHYKRLCCTPLKEDTPNRVACFFYKRKIRIAAICLGLQNALNISDNSSIYNYYGTNRVIIV